jgi:hypothetical protein
MVRAHGRAPWFGPSVRHFKKAAASGRCWEWAAESICEWAAQRDCQWAKTAILDATQKTPTPIAWSRFTPKFISPHGWLAQGK